MELSDAFWKGYELDLQEVKISYLNWAIGYAKEPKPQYRHLFLWDHQEQFSIINSRYGRAFAISPFGTGVREVPRSKSKGITRELDEIDIALKVRLTGNTGRIRNAIAKALQTGNLNDARQMILDFYNIKLFAHELLFDRTQYIWDESEKIRKGRWGLDESEKWQSLTGIRNRIVNVVRYGETLENEYVMNLNRKLPGFTIFSGRPLNYNFHNLTS